MAVQITRSHHLDKAATRALVEDVAATLAAALHFTYAWEGDRLRFKRPGVQGHIDIVDHQVQVFVSKSPLLPVSEAWIREQIVTTMDEHFGDSAA